MSNKELLNQKIKEFEQDHKMTHIEYGLPFASVVNGSVVFCKNKQIFEAYKKKTTASNKKLFIAITTICASFGYGIIGSYIELSNLAIVFGLWAIFLLALASNFIIEKNAKKHSFVSKDIIIYNGPDWMN